MTNMATPRNAPTTGTGKKSGRFGKKSQGALLAGLYVPQLASMLGDGGGGGNVHGSQVYNNINIGGGGSSGAAVPMQEDPNVTQTFTGPESY